jgi:hypothetical protein
MELKEIKLTVGTVGRRRSCKFSAVRVRHSQDTRGIAPDDGNATGVCGQRRCSSAGGRGRVWVMRRAMWLWLRYAARERLGRASKSAKIKWSNQVHSHTLTHLGPHRTSPTSDRAHVWSQRPWCIDDREFPADNLLPHPLAMTTTRSTTTPPHMTQSVHAFDAFV